MKRLLSAIVLGFCLLAPAVAADIGLPKPVVPDCLGVNIHFTGRNDKHVAKIAEGGFKFVRMDFFWSGIERKKGEYNFKPYDALVDSLAKRGIRPLFILDYGNDLYDKGAPHTDEGRAAFARFAAAGVAHFKGRGIVWELWNEPNGKWAWKPEPNPDDYVKLAEMVYPAVKKADPDAILVGPALSCWDFKYWEQVLSKGLLTYVDAVSVHPYGSPIPEDAFRYYQTIRAMMAKHSPDHKDMTVISGEWGYSAVKGITVEKQAELIAREFLVNQANHIPLSIWYDWINDGPDPKEKEHNFGTMYHDFTEKPAYKAVKVLSTQLNGYHFAALLDSGSDKDYLALFANGKDTCVAAWTTGDPHKLVLPVDAEKFASVSLLGDRSELAAKDGKLEFEVSQAVRYIKPVGECKRWILQAGWTVSASTSLSSNGMRLNIESNLDSSPMWYEFIVGGKTVPGSRSGAGFVVPYVPDGAPTATITLVTRVPELSDPLRRTIRFDNTNTPVIDVAPPSADTFMVAVSLPELSGTSLKGVVHVEDYKGIELESDSAAVSLNPGGREMVKLKMKTRPTRIYSFGLRLTGDNGRDVVRVPVKRYWLAETFTQGKPGDEIAGYKAACGRDDKVIDVARLTYARCPQWGPGSVCGKLDYTFSEGARFVQIVPESPMPIPDKPVSAKVWVKGQKNSAPVRLRVRGSDDQTFEYQSGTFDTRQWEIMAVNMRDEIDLHWSGPADGIKRYPLRWDSLLVIDNPGRKPFTGEVFVGPVMLCYD
jgi:hypothetical protein